MNFIIGLIIGGFVGFLACALFASRAMAKLEDKLQAADEIVVLAIKSITALGLWDDKEFTELSKAIDTYEEGE